MLHHCYHTCTIMMVMLRHIPHKIVQYLCRNDDVMWTLTEFVRRFDRFLLHRLLLFLLQGRDRARSASSAGYDDGDDVDDAVDDDANAHCL